MLSASSALYFSSFEAWKIEAEIINKGGILDIMLVLLHIRQGEDDY